MIAQGEKGPTIRRLLVVRLSAMGDVIHTLPAVQVLRDRFPQAMIGWLIEERWAELLCAPGAPARGPRSPQRPLVDWVHTVNLRQWGKSLSSFSTLEQIARVWNDVRSAKYEIAIDLQGAIRSAMLARWSGAPVTYGAAQPRETPATLFYTRSIITRGEHIIKQNVSLVEPLAGTATPARVEFPHDKAAEDHIERVLAEIGMREFAILNPGAGWGAKRWPADRYGEVARALAANAVPAVINYGPGEAPMALAAESASGGTAIALSTSISELIALTRRAKLFIGGDTGPLHLAAALRVPVVGIYGPTDPGRNGPYSTRSAVLRNPVSSTTHARNAQPDLGMLGIGADEVVAAASSLLRQSAQERPPRTGKPPYRGSAHG